jgi:hypothetical protein
VIADNFVKARLASFAYREMNGCGYKAMLAVAYIIRNRVRAGWGNDWNTCLNSAGKFSAFELRPETTVELTSSDFTRLLADVEEIYSGNRADTLTEGGLYYYDVLRQDKKDTPQHRWFAEKIMQDAKNHPRVAQVGMVHIYK